MVAELGEGAETLLYKELPKVGLFAVGKGTLTLMNMACVAFACHYNGVKYYVELKDRSIRKFNSVMALAFGSVLVVFLSMMFGGVMNFGSASKPLILNNFHPTLDAGASLARCLTGCAILSGYPLMMAGLKSALFDVLAIQDSSKKVKDTVTICVLAVITAVATQVTEHELGPLLGVVGAIFGSAVVYVLPAIWNTRAIERMQFFRGEKFFNTLVGVGGVALAVFGTRISLASDAAH